MTCDTFRCLVYADPRSRVEFTHPDNSALISEFKRVFGSRLDLRLVNAEDVRDGSAFQCRPHAFVLPGIFGEKSYYPEHIGPEGNHHIRDFVAKGGLFMGFCAGAYYASESILYQPGWGEHKRRMSDNLSIVSAQAYGPLPGYCEPITEGPDQFPEGWHRVDPVPLIVCEDQSRIEMAYGLGPAFRIAAKGANDIDVIARYADVEGTPPAIIEGRFGHGRAILYGALPQFSHDHPPTSAKSVPPSLTRLLEKLYLNRHARTAFWDSQMQRMAHHHGMTL